MELFVSQAGTSDLAELARLINSAYRGENSRRGWTTEADFLDGQRTDEESLRELLTNSDRAILCFRAAPQAKIIGCVYLENLSPQHPHLCYLGMLTVDPCLQTQGHGSKIMAEAEKFVVENWSAQKMTLGVIQLREPLIAWYEARGYRKTGNTKAFPYGNAKFGIPKRDDLYFVLFEKDLS